MQQGNLEEGQHQQSTLNLEINILGEQQQQHHRTVGLEIGEDQDWGETRWEEIVQHPREEEASHREIVVSEPTSSSIVGMSEGLADGGTGHKQ